jgi:hypothetical protein
MLLEILFQYTSSYLSKKKKFYNIEPKWDPSGTWKHDQIAEVALRNDVTPRSTLKRQIKCDQFHSIDSYQFGHT